MHAFLLSRLKISSRLGWGFGALLALLLLVGTLGMLELGYLNSLNKKIYEHPFAVSNAAQRLYTNAAQMRVVMDELLLTKDPTRLAQARKRMGRLHRKAAGDLKLVDERYLGPPSDLRRLRQATQSIHKLHNRVMTDLTAGKRARALMLIHDDNHRAGAAYIAAVKVIERYAFSEANYFLDQSRSAMSRALLVLSISLVAALVLAGVLVFLLTRSIMRPLGQVAALSESLAAGKPAPPVAYPARDELGRLAASLRVMLSGLVGETRSLKEHIPAVLWMADRELTLTFISPPGARLAEALAGQPLEKIVGAMKVGQVLRDQEELTSLLARDALERGLEGEAEVSFVYNGRAVYLQQVIAPLRDLDGGITGVMGVGLDISHRREMEQALAESESQFRRAIMNAPQPIMLHAEGGEVIQVNEAWTRLSGYAADRFATTEQWLKLAHGGERGARILEAMNTLYGALEGPRREGEFRLRTASGEELIWDISSAPLGRLSDGRPLVLTVAMDVTVSKRAEWEIRQAEERFRTLVQNVPGAVYRCLHDADWTMSFVSAAIEKITGYPAGDFIDNRVRSYESVIHPDDREEVRREVDAALAEKRPFTMEYRILHAGGGERWVFERGSEVRDSKGSFLFLDGVILDITAQRQAEEARLRSEALYSTLFERAGDTILLMVAEGEEAGTIIAANRAAAELHGYQPGELVGMNIRELDTEESAAQAPRRIAKIQAGEWVREEVEHRRKDGSVFPLEISAGPVSINGERYILAMDRDISQRKEADRALARSEAMYRSLFQRAGEGIMLLAVDEPRRGEILSANLAAERMHGCAPGELRGKNILDLDPGATPEILNQRFDILLTGKWLKFEVEHRKKDGSSFPLEANAGLLDLGSERYILTLERDISERKEAVKALARSEALHRNLFQRAGDGILLMAGEGEEAGRIISANRAVERMHGYEPGEMLGMYVRDLVVDPQPGRLERNLAGEWLSFEVEHRRKDGSVFPLEVSVGPVDLGDERFLLAMERDISERKEAERERREREVRFRELFSNMSSGVAVYRPSPDGNEFIVEEMNPAGLRICGAGRAELIGREVREVFPGVEELGLLAVFKRVWATGQPEHLPMSSYHDEKLYLWVENYVCKLPGGEVVAIFDDLTQAKREEQERVRLEGQLMQNQKLEALGTLAGGIAHDFNNILAAIMGYAELALDEVESGGAAADDLGNVLVASERAKNLVGQILSFARRNQEPRSPMELIPLIKESFKLLRASVPVTVEMRLDQPLAGDLVYADPVQMQQVVMNLCTNAAQAMEEEGGVLEVALDRVELDPESAVGYAGLEAGPYLRLTVSDTGQGMTPQVKRRIFEPFFTTKDTSRGTGMGLAVVHGIVQNHGGAITVYSEPGQGTAFHVYVPVYHGKDEAAKVEALPAELGGSERVLWVDDEPVLAELGGRILGRLGYQVTTFTSPLEAWEAFQAAPHSFDAVVSDYTMPQMTGRELAARILEMRPEMPVIICSGFNRQLSEDWLDRLGVGAVLAKPLVAWELAGTLRRLLDARAKSAE